MTFAQQENLLYLWLLPLLIVVFWLGERLLTRRLNRFASANNLAKIYQRPRYRFSGYCCLIVAFISLITALAQPRFSYSWLERPQRGKDLYVVLDVSKSMLATDIKPSRLQRAKRKLHDLLTMLDGDRISLIAFAGASFVHCPLTNDYAAAQLFLDHLSSELIPVQGTAIGDALRLALKSIADTSTADGAAIILLTDGEDQGTEPLKVAQQARRQQVRIFAIGIGGNEGTPITSRAGDLVKDRQGNLVLSRLDETTLQQLAVTTGGSYVRSVSGDFDLQQIYHKGIREQISDQDFADSATKRKVWHEHFYLFVLVALLLLVVEFVARVYRQPSAGIFLLVLIVLSKPVVASDGHDAFAAKDYQQAARKFLEQEIDNPNDLELTYNRAVSQYFDKNYQGAASGFAKATKASDQQLAMKSWFNLGNSQVALKRLEDAQHSYQQALKIDPQNLKAKENLEWVNQQLQKQQQNQQNQQQDQGQQNQQNQAQQNQQNQQQQDQGQQNQQNQQQDQAQQNQQQQDQGQQNQQQDQGQQDHQQQSLSEEEVAKLLRQLDNKIGVRPRKLVPADRDNVQDW